MPVVAGTSWILGFAGLQAPEITRLFRTRTPNVDRWRRRRQPAFEAHDEGSAPASGAYRGGYAPATMRRAGFLLLLAGLCAGCGGEPEAAPDALPCGIAPITQGHGAPGPYAVSASRIPNPAFPDQPVERFLPRGAEPPLPVIVLAHAFNEGDVTRYRGLIDHLVSRGSAVVFPVYEGVEKNHRRVETLWSGIVAALEAPGPPLDTARIGFIGHSYGAGALPALALRAVAEKGWAGDALFLAFLAPWFAVEVEDEMLAGFPDHAKALFLVFEDDSANDHRIAIDLYREIGVPPAAKDYLLVGSDAHAGCELPALHTLPMSEGPQAADDALDAYALYRLLDALVALSFDADPAAGRIALGHGSPEQLAMGSFADGTPMRALVGGPDPKPAQDPSFYLFRADQRERWLHYGTVH